MSKATPTIKSLKERIAVLEQENTDLLQRLAATDKPTEERYHSSHIVHRAIARQKKIRKE